MSDSESENSVDENWEEISVDSDGFSDPSGNSSGEDSDNVEPDDEVEVIRGAEPYRFEPLARQRRVQRQQDDEAAGDEDEEQDANVQRLAAANVRLNNTDWCSCGKCVVMEFAHNCLCCKEVAVIQEKILHTGVNPDGFNCFTDHPWYEATCLNPGTLETAYYAYKQQYGARAIEGDLARKYRHVSYRQVIRWCYGYLGRHNRVPLPSCIMHKSRITFPDADGNYEGFRYPDLDEM